MSLRSAALSLALMIATVSSVSGRVTKAEPLPGGKVVVHRAGGPALSQPSRGRAMMLRSGFVAAEPTIATDSDGSLFLAAASLGADRGVDVLKLEPGADWEVTSPRLAGVDSHPVTLDPYVYRDPTTDRIYSVDLTVDCSFLSFSDDGGENWTTNPFACGRPVNDHQTLFSGPPVSSPTIGYPSIVYYCFNDLLTSSCSKSLDGGLTFAPTGSSAFAPNADEGHCLALHGQGVVDAQGRVFLPKAHCGSPWVAISSDEGVTWSRVKIAKTKVASSDSDPSVAIDSDGNVYYVWVGEDRLPYLSVSSDHGSSWSKPVMVAAPGITETNLVTLAAGSKGRIAIAYVGSENSPFQDCSGQSECAAPYSGVTWNGYVAVTRTALKGVPLMYSARVNRPSDPFVVGRCGPGRCYPLWDFLDIQVDDMGKAWAAFVDGKSGSDRGEGVVGTIEGLFDLR